MTRSALALQTALAVLCCTQRRLIAATVAIGIVLAACGAGSVPASACSVPTAGPSSAPTDDTVARLHAQAQAALARWGDAVAAAAAGPQAFVPTGELTSQIGDWEANVGDNDKSALLSGMVEVAGSLPTDPPPNGPIVWKDGTTATVGLISAARAAADIRASSTGDCGGCTPLRITGAHLTTGSIETSRGLATVPMWAFTVQGTRVLVTRVAVANQVTVAPPPWDAYHPPLGLRVERASVPAGGRELTVFFTGAPDPATQPCGADYSAEGVESATAVVVIIDEHPYAGPYPSNWGCVSVGHERSASIELGAPLGSRAVLEVTEGLPVPVVASP
jgi:hypothetical protein